MAIYINGIKIAGRGISGKSPYQVAVEGGYSGTEADFNAQLAAIGEAVVGFDELRDLVENSKTEVEEAVASAREDIETLQQESADLKVEINQTIENANTEITTIVNNAENRIDEKVEDALASIPDSENLATKAYVQEQMATLVTDIWSYGATAPSNTKLFWIDSNTTTGGLKYYNGSAWVHVPVAWS